mgnify:CR=1 FL=1
MFQWLHAACSVVATEGLEAVAQALRSQVTARHGNPRGRALLRTTCLEGAELNGQAGPWSTSLSQVPRILKR